MQKVVRKVLQQRLWPDEAGAQWKKSVQDLGYEVLCGASLLELLWFHDADGQDSEPVHALRLDF